MKKRIVNLLMLVILLFISKSFTLAQSQTSEYTLQQCIDFALANYNDVKNADLDVQSAAAKVGEIRGMGLPQISGNVSINDNPELKRMFLPGASAASFDPGSSLNAPGGGGRVYEPYKIYGIPNLFQQRTTGDAYLGLNQLLFDGSYFLGLQGSKIYKELASKSMTQTKIQVVENVTKAFYMVLINHEQYELVKANAERLDTLFRNSQAYFKEGFVEEIDVLRLEVASNNLKAELTKFKQMNEVTYLLLKFQMGMPLSDSLTLSGSIKDAQLGSVDKDFVVNPESRVEYSLLKTKKELSLFDLKNTRVKYWPTLSGYANGGYTRSDVNVAETLKNTWYPYLMWGVNLKIPIVAGGSNIYKVKQAKYAYAKSENTLNQFANVVDLQVKQSVINLENEMQNMQIQERNLELSKKVLESAKAKMTVGTGSNLELIDAENAFKTAQTNYYQATYNLLLAKIEYEKSKGTLYSE